MQEEADSAKDEADKLRPMKKTLITDKVVEAQEECSKEGGAFMLDQANKATQSNENIAVKIGHHEEECKKNKCELACTSRQLTNYATNSNYDDHGRMFVMRHRAHSMSASNLTSASSLEDVWLSTLVPQTI